MKDNLTPNDVTFIFMCYTHYAYNFSINYNTSGIETGTRRRETIDGLFNAAAIFKIELSVKQMKNTKS